MATKTVHVWLGAPGGAARVASAATRAAPASAPPAACASPQARPLAATNSRPSGDANHAAACSGSTVSPDATCRSRPITAMSQPTPTAPGPNRRQWSSSGTLCRRLRSVPPACGSRRSSIRLAWPPDSQVAAKERGGSQRSIVPLALPCTWKRPPGRRSPLTGRNQRGMRSALVQASQTSSTGASYGRVSGIVLPSTERSISGSLLELVTERIQVRLPEAAEALQPRVDVTERHRVHRVQPARAVGAHLREPTLAQYAKVLRHGRLADAELVPDGRRAAARRPLAVGQQLEDAAADRLAQDVERMHISCSLYA